MAIADASGFPIAADIQSASPHEVKLVEKTIDKRFLNKTPDLPDEGFGSESSDGYKFQNLREVVPVSTTSRKMVQFSDESQ